MKQYDEMMNKMQEQFEDLPEMPESLSKENIVKSIKEKEISPSGKKTFGFKMEAVAAAVVVLIVAGVALVQHNGGLNVAMNNELASDFVVPTTQSAAVQNHKFENEQESEQNEVVEGNIRTFKDSESVREHFRELYKSVYYGSDYVVFDGDLTAVSALNTVGATMAATAAPGAAQSESYTDDALKGETTQSYAQTNTQVKGVDEGDIIKNDGRYIYLVTGNYDYEPRIKIVDAESMKMVYNGKFEGRKAENVSVKELYVSGDILTVVYTESSEEQDKKYTISTIYDVYDIKDREKPKKLCTKSQDGSFVSSRMIGSVLYTISIYGVKGESEEDVVKYALPYIDGKEMDGCFIYHFDDNSTVYTVVTALDTANTNDSSSIAILGGSDEIYCSGTTLYGFYPTFKEGKQKTVITSFSLDGTKVEYKAQGEIDGQYNNNYSFDEYDGYLRAAVSYYDRTTYKDVSSIYVLNEKLEVVGSAENIANDEQVKSVRFMGKKGYVVTFRQTDPLFSLDLSDPKNPKVMGELKLPGYSTYLHPLSETLLLGIGYGGDEENADTGDLKIALFDVSDMTKPQLLDDFIIECASSEANHEPKALIHYSEKNIIGIPVTDYNYYGTAEVDTVRSFAIIRYSDNELTEVKGFVHESDAYNYLFRGTYIGEKLYTVDMMKIIEHNLQNGEKLRECPIFKEEEKIVRKYEIVTTPAVTASGGIIETLPSEN